jgi:hypothetical protein
MALQAVCGFQNTNPFGQRAMGHNNFMQELSTSTGNMENPLSLAVPPFENVRLLPIVFVDSSSKYMSLSAG